MKKVWSAIALFPAALLLAALCAFAAGPEAAARPPSGSGGNPPAGARAASPGAGSACVSCHQKETPGIVSDWYGWSEMKRDLTDIQTMAGELRRAHGEAKGKR